VSCLVSTLSINRDIVVSIVGLVINRQMAGSKLFYTYTSCWIGLLNSVAWAWQRIEATYDHMLRSFLASLAVYRSTCIFWTATTG
jgi:hypothetical protein